MSRYRLARLGDRFEGEISQVEADFLAALNSYERRRLVITGERCLVFLQDAYSRFIRDLILRSAMGNATTATGRKVAPGPRGVLRQTDALTYLRQNWKPRQMPGWWEPDWYRNKMWGPSLRLLAPRNSATIAAALGSSASPSEHLRKVRNFAVHRGPESAHAAARVGVSYGVGRSWRQPADILRASNGGQLVIEQWCAQFRAIYRAAIQ